MRKNAAALLKMICGVVEDPRTAKRTDQELLRRFRAESDEGAFRGLVQRHGSMVLDVCRNVLGNQANAEDAFQATFLVLVQKAKAIRKDASVGSWLYGVAYRIAHNARTSAARRQKHEARYSNQRPTETFDDLSWREVRQVMYEELHRISEGCRATLVLCYLEGKTQDEAATVLGVSKATVKKRLERGRALLRGRLVRRGLGPMAVLAAAGWPLARASARPVPVLVSSTVKAATRIASGQASAADLFSTNVIALTEGGMRAMFLTKVKLATVLLLVAGLLGGVTGFVVRASVLAEEKRDSPNDMPKQIADRSPKADPSDSPAGQPGPGPSGDGKRPRVDLHGDPLPDGAALRLGTLRRRAIGATLALSPDGRSLVGVRGGKYVSVWDTATGALRETRELPVETWNFWLSGDGRWLATATPGKGSRTGLPDELTVWDVHAARKVRTFKTEEGRYVLPAAFSPDAKTVAAVRNADGQKVHFVHAWDLENGKELFAKEVRVEAAPGVLAFSPDGKRLLASFKSRDEGTHCWDAITGEHLWQNKDFVPSAVGIVFTPDGRALAPASRLPAVDIATGRAARLEGLRPLTWEDRPTLTPDGKTLLLATSAGVEVWDLVQGKQGQTLPAAGAEVLVTADGKSLITNNGALQRWDLATGRPLWADNSRDGPAGEVLALAFSADGGRLASASADGSVWLWDARTGKPLHTWVGHARRRPLGADSWTNAGATAIDLSPDGRWVLSGGSEGRLRLYDGSTGKEVVNVGLPEGDKVFEGRRPVYHVRVSADGSSAQALFGGGGGIVWIVKDRRIPGPTSAAGLAIWDLRTGRLLTSSPLEGLKPSSSALSPDGRTALCGNRLIDTATGSEAALLDGAPAYVTGDPAAFSPDGALVACVFEEGSGKGGTASIAPGVRVWEAATGKRVADFKTSSWAGRIAFYPDGRLVAASGDDGVRVWDMTSGKVVATCQPHERVPASPTGGIGANGFASCLAVSPDGRRLATGHPDGTVLLWDVPLPPREPEALRPKETARGRPADIGQVGKPPRKNGRDVP